MDRRAAAIEIYRLNARTRSCRLAEVCRLGARATTPVLPRLSLAIDALFT